MPNSEEFPQIKRDLVNTVKDIKKHIDGESVQREEVRILLGRVSIAIFGDAMANPPIEGYHARLERLEKEINDQKQEKKDSRTNAINLAVGSAAIAIGGAVCWVAVAVKEAFMKGH